MQKNYNLSLKNNDLGDDPGKNRPVSIKRLQDGQVIGGYIFPLRPNKPDATSGRQNRRIATPPNGDDARLLRPKAIAACCTANTHTSHNTQQHGGPAKAAVATH